MKYEATDDVSNYVLSIGASKLNTYGMDVFEMFANEVGMSFCDRNRCIAKCRLAYNRPDLLEMACPDELKQERWELYTKRLMYSQKKATELLSLVDKSYKNQFIPVFESEKLAGRMLKEA